MQITTQAALEIQGPIPKRRPFGLLSHINWLTDADILGVNKAKPEGTASDPAVSTDGESGANTATGFDGSAKRWESGVYTHPLGLISDAPAGGDDDLVSTGMQLKNSDWGTSKTTNLGLAPRDSFAACTLIWRERRSTFEMTKAEQVRRAHELMDLCAQTYLERWLYQLLLADDLFNITAAGDSDSTLYPTIKGAIAGLEANWTEPGVPTIHIPFFSYPFMPTGWLEVNEDGPNGEAAKYTPGGTPVIMATGHPNMIPVDGDDPVVPEDESIALYATGPVFGYQSADAELVSMIDDVGRRANDRLVQIERTFVVGWNSYRALVATANPASD